MPTSCHMILSAYTGSSGLNGWKSIRPSLQVISQSWSFSISQQTPRLVVPVYLLEFSCVTVKVENVHYSYHVWTTFFYFILYMVVTLP